MDAQKPSFQFLHPTMRPIGWQLVVLLALLKIFIINKIHIKIVHPSSYSCVMKISPWHVSVYGLKFNYKISISLGSAPVFIDHYIQIVG